MRHRGIVLDDCYLWCIVSLPGSVFTAAHTRAAAAGPGEE